MNRYENFGKYDEVFPNKTAASAHYYRDINAYLDENLPSKWAGRQDIDIPRELPAHSANLTEIQNSLRQETD